MNYKAAMSQLEKISEEIHEQRKMIDLPLLREPGVGCESDEEFPQEIDLGKCVCTHTYDLHLVVCHSRMECKLYSCLSTTFGLAQWTGRDAN